MWKILLIAQMFRVVVASNYVLTDEDFTALNGFGRTERLKDGVAPLTASTKLNGIGFEAIGANGPIMKLTKFVNKTKAPDAFKTLLSQLHGHIGGVDKKANFKQQPYESIVLKQELEAHPTEELKQDQDTNSPNGNQEVAENSQETDKFVLCEFFKGRQLQESTFGRVFLGMTKEKDCLVAIKQAKTEPPTNQTQTKKLDEVAPKEVKSDDNTPKTPATEDEVNLPQVDSNEEKIKFKTEALNALRNEATMMKILGDHRGLVQLIADGINVAQAGTSDEYNVVMEYLDGDIFEFFRLLGERFPMETAIGIMYEILLALWHMHESDTGHRDVKIENIMSKLVHMVIQIKLIDFGKSVDFQNLLDDDLAMGTLETMSKFTHWGDVPGKRDDVLGVLYTFMLFVNGSLGWESKCKKLEEALKAKLPSNGEITKLHHELGGSKQTEAKLFGDLHIEFGELIAYVDTLGIDSMPDYIYILNLVLKMTRKWNIFGPTRFAWDTNIRSLLLGPEVINADVRCAASDEEGWTFEIIYEKFYEHAYAEFKTLCRDAKISDALCTVARDQSASSTQKASNCFEAKIPADKIERFGLSYFSKNKEIMEMTAKHKTVFVGFGYFYTEEMTEKMYTVNMAVRSLLEVLFPYENTNNHKLPESFRETALLNQYSARYLALFLEDTELPIDLDRPHHFVYPVILEDTFSNLEDALESAFSKLEPEVFQNIMNGNLAEMGHDWRYFVEYPTSKTWNTTENHKLRKLAVIFTFASRFDILSLNFSVEGKGNGELSESLNDRITEGEILKQTGISRSVKFNDLAAIPTYEDVIDSQYEIQNHKKTITVAAEAYDETLSIQDRLTKLAEVSAEKEELNPALLNVRQEWTVNPDNSLSVRIVQDNCYLVFLKNIQSQYTKFLEKVNKWTKYIPDWKLSEASHKLRQKANDIAFEMQFKKGLVTTVEEGQGLYVFGIVIEFEKSVECSVSRLENILTSSEKNPTIWKLNPYDTYSVTFGFSWKRDGTISGVSIHEAFCYDALRIVNEERTKRELSLLHLHPKHDQLGETYRKNLGTTCDTEPNDSEICPIKFKSDNSSTPKEALTEYVIRVFSNKTFYKTDYEKFLHVDATHLSFTAFQDTNCEYWNVKTTIYTI